MATQRLALKSPMRFKEETLKQAFGENKFKPKINQMSPLML